MLKIIICHVFSQGLAYCANGYTVERLSVAFFLGAQHDATVPLLTLPAALAADARGATSDPDNPLFQHVGTNYLKGRLRSHPDVAKRHYSDLIDAQAPFETKNMRRYRKDSSAGGPGFEP
jgi:hypothetical protein